VNCAIEFPVVGYEQISGGIGERFRHRITGSPGLNFAVIASEAHEMYAGAGIGGVPVRAVVFQITL
jgi:hypothetical protein